MSKLIMASLETCADQGVDITDDVYARFFVADNPASALMDHSDQYMRGRMLQEVIDLLLSEDDEGGLKWEVDNHLKSYNVDVSMYATFFEALKTAVASQLGEQWTPAYAQAWSDRISSMLQQIEDVASAQLTDRAALTE